MDYKIWLDDQCFDADLPARQAPDGFIAAPSSLEAMVLVKRYGVPSFIDFDHDLGEQDNAMVFLKWLSDHYPDVEFEYNIHTANPVGAANIKSYIDSWFRSRTM